MRLLPRLTVVSFVLFIVIEIKRLGATCVSTFAFVVWPLHFFHRIPMTGVHQALLQVEQSGLSIQDVG